jgi:hypothetical protein
MLNVIMLNVIMLNVNMLNVIMLIVIMLNVIMLSVAGPFYHELDFFRRKKTASDFQFFHQSSNQKTLSNNIKLYF